MDRDREGGLTLVYQERAGIGLLEALSAAAPLPGFAEAVAILSSPERHELARLDRAGRLRGPAGETSLDGVFEARVFGAEHELRWMLDPEGGRAVLLSEGTPAAPPQWTVIARVSVQRLQILTYLVMGVSDGRVADGWTRLTAGRTRAIEVPLETSAPRVAVRAVEYAARSPHGNVHVCEERLLELVPAM